MEGQEPYAALLQDSAEDLFEAAPCGYLSVLTDGTIVKVNQTFLNWTGRRREDVLGRTRFADLLTVGGRIFHETHLAPLLRMQREIREIAVDFVRADGTRLATLINAVLRTDLRTGAAVVRLTVFNATDRRRYEQELLRERRRAERNAARVRVLQEMVAHCATITEPAEIVAPIVAAGARAFDATDTTVWVLRADGTALITAHPATMARHLPDELPLKPGAPYTRAVAEQIVITSTAPPHRAGPATLHAFTPLVANDRTLGVVSFGFTDGGELHPDELELMGTLGRQAGQALERARLHEETTRRARQSAFLAAMTGELEKTLTFAERVRRLIELIVPALASYARIEVPDTPDAGWFAAASSDRARDRWPDPEVVRAALATAVHSGVPETVPPPRDSERATIVLPLRARGRVLGGLLLVANPQGQVGSDADFLGDLADRAGLALENARLHDEDREVARVLQRSLLAQDPPIDPRFQVIAAYQSGVENLEVGGDWHDTFTTTKDRVGLVIGDVVGRGIRAASAMGQLRSAVRALALARFGPSTVLEHMDQFVATMDSAQMATLVIADLALDTGELRYACAGHPPPLLLAPGDEPRYLWGGRSGPIGSFATGTSHDEDKVTLARGSRLVLYTDGLVERRGQSLDQGLSNLSREAADRRHIALEELVGGLTEAMLSGARSRDDVCLLALEYDDAPSFRRVVASDTAHLAVVRAEFRRWLTDQDVPEQEQYGIVLACSEAMANAIEHGYGNDPTNVLTLSATLSQHTLEVRVCDRGKWRPRQAPTDRGRGMGLMARAMDDLIVDRGDGTTVIMRRRLGKARNDAG